MERRIFLGGVTAPSFGVLLENSFSQRHSSRRIFLLSCGICS